MVLLAQAVSAGGVDETNLDDASMAELKFLQMTTDLVHASSHVMGAVASSKGRLGSPRRRAKAADEQAPKSSSTTSPFTTSSSTTSSAPAAIVYPAADGTSSDALWI